MSRPGVAGWLARWRFRRAGRIPVLAELSACLGVVAATSLAATWGWCAVVPAPEWSDDPQILVAGWILTVAHMSAAGAVTAGLLGVRRRSWPLAVCGVLAGWTVWCQISLIPTIPA